jgi:hypothetical protein
MGNSGSNSQCGCKFLGQGRIRKWVEFHCFHASLWNGTPTPLFICQKYGYSVGGRAIGCQLVRKLPKSLYSLATFYFLQLLWVYTGCNGAASIRTQAVMVQDLYIFKNLVFKKSYLVLSWKNSK